MVNQEVMMTSEELEIMDLIGNECLRRKLTIDLTTVHVHQSELATRCVGPKVLHVRRWWHTAHHHAFMQKVYNERYGMDYAPSLYIVDPSKTTAPILMSSVQSLSVQKPYLLVHPKLWPILHRIIETAKTTKEQSLMPIPLQHYLSMDDLSFDYQYADHKVQPGQVYAHYKAGDYYKVITLSQRESDGLCEVVYRNIHGKVFHRPLVEWVAEIKVRDLLHIPRFVLRADIKFPLAADHFWVLTALDSVANTA